MPERSGEEIEEVKILFRFYGETLEESVIERLRASVEDGEKGLYKIDNIGVLDYAEVCLSHDY